MTIDSLKSSSNAAPRATPPSAQQTRPKKVEESALAASEKKVRPAPPQNEQKAEKAEPARPVVNTQGQTTGRLISTSA